MRQKNFIPKTVSEILKAFPDILESETVHLPPHRSVDHRIDLVHGASLPNLAHYRLSPSGAVA